MFKLYYPLAAAWVIFSAVLLSGVLEPRYELLNLEFITFFAFQLIFFLITYTIGYSLKIKFPVLVIHYRNALRYFTILMITALLAYAIDRFYIRSISFNLLEVRETRAQHGSNLFSIIWYLLWPMIIILRECFLYIKNKFVKFLFFFFILVVIFDLLVSGSRGALLLIFAWFGFRYISLRKFVLFVPLLLFVFSLFFLHRFQNRSGGSDNDYDLIYNLVSSSAYGVLVPYNFELPDFIHSYALFSIVHIFQYVTHGLFEYANAFNSAKIVAINPNFFLPVLNKLYISDPSVFNLRSGVYYTLFGSIYIAFKQSALVVTSIVGFLLGFALKFSLHLGKGAYGVMLAIIFLSVFVNSVGGFAGIYFLFAVFMVSFIRVNRTH